MSAPVQSGIISSCRDYHLVENGDSCYEIQNQYMNFTLDQFYSWNPYALPQTLSVVLNKKPQGDLEWLQRSPDWILCLRCRQRSGDSNEQVCHQHSSELFTRAPSDWRCVEL